MRSVSLFCLCGALTTVGCSADGELEVGSSRKSVAVVTDTAEQTRVIFTTEENAGELSALLDGETPKTFRWISVELPPATASKLTSDGGAVIDLAQANSQAVFAQVYRDVCNPAADDFSPCWLYESYAAGEPGLSGMIRLQIVGTQIEGQFRVQWEGLTDRFAGQQQWHRHETDAGAIATIIEVTP